MIEAQKSSEKKQKAIEDIDNSVEIGLFGGRDSIVPMTRADSGMLDGKSTEEKIIKLNLEKRKSLMKIESRREIIGDEVANKMIESIEANY